VYSNVQFRIKKGKNVIALNNSATGHEDLMWGGGIPPLFLTSAYGIHYIRGWVGPRTGLNAVDEE
jgi:hypothetical protein